MEINRYLVFIRDKDRAVWEDKTASVRSCLREEKGYRIVFEESSKSYIYSAGRVVFREEPVEETADAVAVEYDDGTEIVYPVRIQDFQDYIRLFLADGSVAVHPKSRLVISGTASDRQFSRICFDYFKKIATDFKYIKAETGDEEDCHPLVKPYATLSRINARSMLNAYFQGKLPEARPLPEDELIFPFGCNLSQMRAVKKTFANRLCLIEGPPGTGKTQTILNLIANAVLQGKSVAIVSNNNAATKNVREKLGEFKFIVASLGSLENQRNFFDSQSSAYPDWLGHRPEADLEKLTVETAALRKQLEIMFEKQNRLAELRMELAGWKREEQYFLRQYRQLIPLQIKKTPPKSQRVLKVGSACKTFRNKGRQVSFWVKFKAVYIDHIADFSFFRLPYAEMMPALVRFYYKVKIQELATEISDIEHELEKFNFERKQKELRDHSLILFRAALWKRYEGRAARKVFGFSSVKQEWQEFLREYPVILSSTYSICNCRGDRNPQKLYDYVIVDEASQVDLATGALAMACAENLVVSGDVMQLPYVISSEDRDKIRRISESMKIRPAYRYEEHCLLASLRKVFPEAPHILLREHYRCHPKIINFCNLKYYDNQLIIMTRDRQEPDVLKVCRTVPGAHEFHHFNQRQVDEVVQEIIPGLLKSGRSQEEIEVITPYRGQAKALRGMTVHKYQGRESKVIIISTVDNNIQGLSADPKLLNVAVSRAREQLILVLSGSNRNFDNDVMDLVNYIRYNNFEITEGKVRSVFDLLYSEYEKQREKYLFRGWKKSRYDSENLMHTLLDEVFQEEGITNLEISHEYLLCHLFYGMSGLTADEEKYVYQGNSHVDFLIWNKFSRMPVFGVEVDGFEYHQPGSEQSKRDALKDSVFRKAGLDLLRFSTKGSGEKTLLKQALKRHLEAGRS